MPNRYPSPRSDFQKNKKFTEEHGKLIEWPAFDRAIEVAKAEYVRQVTALDTVEPHTSMMRFQRLTGVEEFVKILYNLAEQPTPPARAPDQDNLTPPGGKPRRH